MPEPETQAETRRPTFFRITISLLVMLSLFGAGLVLVLALNATEINRMAQITVVDAHGYNVSLDANGDGNLDPPVFVDLKDQNLKIDGPFPRMYMFDAQGRTVDPGRNPITSGAITLSNGSGKSVINLVNPTSPAKSGSNR